jgi:hypothetical protein
MYATSGFYSQIYPSLLPGRQFSNLADIYPLPTSWEHCMLEDLIEPRRIHTSITIPLTTLEKHGMTVRYRVVRSRKSEDAQRGLQLVLPRSAETRRTPIHPNKYQISAGL